MWFQQDQQLRGFNSLAAQVEIGGKTVRVGGIAKGSGMIHPNMATMLSVVTCDAAVDVDLWRALFKRAAVKSFNQVRGARNSRDGLLTTALRPRAGSYRARRRRVLQPGVRGRLQTLFALRSLRSLVLQLMEAPASGAPPSESFKTCGITRSKP